MKHLQDKIAVITGGTAGIGLATAQRLCAEGATVYACGRHAHAFPDGASICYHALDVTSTDSCLTLYNDVLAAHGRIDILVANAGITRDAMTAKMDDAMFDSVLNTDLKGIFNMVRLVGPCMERQGGGAIVTVSSIVGQYGNIGQANYAAAKAGIIGMSKSWAKEFARKGVPVRVNTVAPGYILTDMVKSVPAPLLEQFAQNTMLKRLGTPEEVADVIAFLVSPQASYITGSVIEVNGGMRL